MIIIVIISRSKIQVGLALEKTGNTPAYENMSRQSGKKRPTVARKENSESGTGHSSKNMYSFTFRRVLSAIVRGKMKMMLSSDKKT
jgi:hypothetical protein